jgi:hypothetical protein
MGEKSSSARRAVKTATAKDRKEAEAKRATAKVELEEIGKQIAARVKIMRSYDAAAKEKAGHDLRKAQDERDAINNVLLAQARAKCKEAGESFEKFRNQYCPDLSDHASTSCSPSLTAARPLNATGLRSAKAWRSLAPSCPLHRL